MTDSARHRSATLRPAVPPSHPQDTHFRPPSPTPTVGIRAHLAHLLPRHAAFTVTLTIHQLNNVPLVHGEFGLRWKIKGVTSNSGTGILDKVKARKAKAKANFCHRPAPPSMAKGSDTDNASLFDAASASDAHSVANSSSDHASGPTTHIQSLAIPAVIVSANHASPPRLARSVSGASSVVSASSFASNGRLVHNPPRHLSAGWSPHGPAKNPTLIHDTHFNDEAPTKHHYSPAKGITPFVKLKEHSVVWEKTLKFVVQMSVARDNDVLTDCSAKFIVMQRVIAGDPDAPRNPRLGVVYLNLAQYVNAGVVTRRYLLRQSKINATLKLSIHLEYTAGESAYVAPPLPKEEILSGVAGFLESSDVYRSLPRASDLYTHASSDFSSDDDAGSDVSFVSGSGTSNGIHGLVKQRRPFEVAKLPSINDPRGTEKLIEALFNPVPVTQPNKITPFTYLIEVDGDGDGDGYGEGDGEHRSCRTNTGSEGRVTRFAAIEVGDDGSLYADSQDESEGEADGLKSDYHSLRSQPSAHGSLRSKHSIRSLASQAGRMRDDGCEEMAVSTGVLLQGGVSERRTWWQKALSSPGASG